MKKHLERIHSPQLGRGLSLWSYGHFGPPLLVFPTAAGFAHECFHGTGLRLPSAMSSPKAAPVAIMLNASAGVLTSMACQWRFNTSTVGLLRASVIVGALV